MIWPDKIRKEKQREKRSDGELVTLRLFTICVIGAVALNGKRKAQIRSACSLLGAWKRVCKAHLEVIDHRCHTNPGSAEIKGVSNWSAGCRTKALRSSRTESNKLCKHVVVSRRQRKKVDQWLCTCCDFWSVYISINAYLNNATVTVTGLCLNWKKY